MPELPLSRCRALNADDHACLTRKPPQNATPTDGGRGPRERQADPAAARTARVKPLET